MARYRLGRSLSKLDGSKDLVIALAEGRTLPLVERVVARRLTRADELALERLRQSLDRLPAARAAR